MDLADRQHQLYHIKGIWMIKKIVSTRHFMDRIDTKKEAKPLFFAQETFLAKSIPLISFNCLTFVCI